MQRFPGPSRCKSAPTSSTTHCTRCTMRRIMDWMTTGSLSDALCEECERRETEKRRREAAARGESSHAHDEGGQGPAPRNQGGDVVDPGEGTSKDHLPEAEQAMMGAGPSRVVEEAVVIVESDDDDSSDRSETDSGDRHSSNQANVSSDYQLVVSETEGGSTENMDDIVIEEEILDEMEDETE